MNYDVQETIISIGTSLRNERKRKGFTLKQLAEKANLSISFLSEIERDITPPSIGTLKRISNALGINMASLFGEPMGSTREPLVDTVLRKKSWREIVYSSKSKIRWYLLTSNIEKKNMEPLVAILEPGASSDDEGTAHPQGEEFVMVLVGEIELWVGSKRNILYEGDSLYFDATIPHRYLNLSNHNSMLLAISSPPGF